MCRASVASLLSSSTGLIPDRKDVCFAMFRIVIWAVSYTHLADFILFASLFDCLVAPFQRHTQMPPRHAVGDAESVSYTHLDVYKRQPSSAKSKAVPRAVTLPPAASTTKGRSLLGATSNQASP